MAAFVTSLGEEIEVTPAAAKPTLAMLFLAGEGVFMSADDLKELSRLALKVAQQLEAAGG